MAEGLIVVPGGRALLGVASACQPKERTLLVCVRSCACVCRSLHIADDEAKFKANRRGRQLAALAGGESRAGGFNFITDIIEQQTR